MLYPVLALLLLATSLSYAASNTHYRWLDKFGNPVHSDRPPPAGTEYEVVSTGSNMVRKVSASEGAVPAVAEPSVGNQFEAVIDGKPKPPAKNPEYCKRAQDNLNTLDSTARIRIRNDEGEFRYLNEEEKELGMDRNNRLSCQCLIKGGTVKLTY